MAISYEEYKKRKKSQEVNNASNQVKESSTKTFGVKSYSDYVSGLKTKKREQQKKVTNTGYVDTGKKLGQYSKFDYKNRKNWKVYSKDNKFYFYNERTKKYEQITNNTGNEMVSADSIKTKPKIENKKKPLAPVANNTPFTTQNKNNNIADGKFSSKGNGGTTPIKKSQEPKNLLNVENQLKLDTSSLTGDEYNQYAGELKAAQEKKKSKYSKANNSFADSLKEKGSATVTTTSYLLNKGITKGVESILDAGATAGALIADKAGNIELSENLQEWVKEDRTSKRVDNLKNEMKLAAAENNTVIKRDNIAGKVIEGIGQQIPTIFGGNVIKGGKLLKNVVSYGLAGLQGTGMGAEEALNEGANIDEATLYSVTSGAKEIATEWITGGIPGIKGTAGKNLSLDKLVAKGLGEESLDQMSKSITKSLIKSGYKMAGEGLEEGVSEALTPILKNAIYSQGETIDWNNVLESTIVGAISGGILNLPSSAIDFHNAKNYQKQSSIQNIINNEQIFQENSRNQEMPNIMNSTNLQESFQNNQQSFQDEVGETIDVNELKNAMEIFKKRRKEIADNKEREQLSVWINELQNKVAELENVNNKFIYENTNDERINKLRKSASEYLDNSNKAKDLVNTIEKMIADKNYNVVFDNSIVNSNGDEVNAQIKTLDSGDLEIRINPNSERTGEFLLAHEITHAIETEEMKNLVMDYASKNQDFNSSLESLKNTYNTNDVSDEILADISGQLFGNQEFINELSMKEPSVFKKIYNKIIELANKITGNSRESLFVKDLKNKWQEAYIKQNNNLKKTTKYSIQKDDNGNKYVNVDTDQELFNNLSLKEQGQMAKMVIMDKYSDSGIDFNDININVNSRTASEYTNPLQRYSNSSKKAKYRLSTELDNLLNVSKKINRFPIPNDNTHKKHSFAKDGWDYYYSKFKVGDKEFIGKLNIGLNGGKKTLYDVTDVYDVDTYKKMTENGKLDKSSVALIRSFTDNNISNFNKNVKSNISTKYSMQNNENNSKWQEYLEKNYKSTGTRTNFEEIKRQISPISKQLQKEVKEINKTIAPLKTEIKQLAKDLEKSKKMLNPTEISNLTKEVASTTPEIAPIKVSSGDGQSKFFDNIKDKVNMLDEDSKAKILSDDEVKYYKEVTNEDSLNKAFKRLSNEGAAETLSWFNRKSENATDVDVAEGWILMKQYEDSQDYDSMIQVAKKMREIGTKAGQTVQAFNIMNRMTPEGMVKYAQSELSEAYEKMVKNKTKKWIEKYRNDFELTPEETSFIVETMNEVKEMENGYDKRVKLAEIQKIMTDKLPPERGQGIKSWMRISMLFNPKTQVRNVMGNALIAPVNAFGDLFASGADRVVSLKTGVRTVGKTSLKSYGKGMKKGLFQSYNDFKKGINTRNLDGDRFEIGEGKSFNDRTLIGKSLNKVDNLLSFMLDAGDRVFYEGAFVNSINNQMVLNKADTVTQEMIDIATNEALSRTWQDNNNYTKFVLNIRKGLNNVNIKGYGLGDVLIPFAKTPANLTKALIDYSPAGMINVLLQGKKLKNSLATDQYTSQMQHQFVQTLGKATAGTMLYILGIALAKTGIISGESDDDKDTANFIKNTLGVNSYSIKIGDKSFTYDWAQPVAGVLSIAANIVNSKENQGQALLEGVVSSLDSAGSIFLEQSFMQSINDVLSNNDGVVSGIINQILTLPSRAVPTFSKQIVDLVDGTQRTSFEYGKPLESSINSIKSKIPFVSKDLAPTVDTLGREVKKYGGKNNLFNVFLNPANVANDNTSESAKEIYGLYKETGDNTIMPRVAPYYVNNKGEKIILTSKQREQFQKQAGRLVDESVNRLMKTDDYKEATDIEKASMINGIVGYSYNLAQHNEVGTEISKTYKKANKFVGNGGNLENYYIYKNGTENMTSNEKENYLYRSQFSSKQKTLLYENVTLSNFDDDDKYLKYKTSKKLGIDIDNWLNYSSQKFESSYDSKGKTIKNSKRDSIVNFVNSLNLSIPQKASLIKMSYPSYKKYDNVIMNYVDNVGLNYLDKAKTVKTLGFSKYDKSIIGYVTKNYSSIEEQSKVLKNLGFNVYKANGKTYVR